MDFPLHDLMDEQACYEKLVRALHPQGLCCPRCGGGERTVHRAHRAPVRDYRCKACRRVFNAFTGTILQGTHRRPSQLMLILRGVAQGATTARLAREMGLSRWHLLELRRKLQSNAARGRDREPLPDAVAEADEMYQNAGEKKHPAPRSRGSAAPPGEQGQRPRHVGNRPSTGAGPGRTRKRHDPTACAATQQPPGVGRAGACRHPARLRGEYR